MTNREFFIRCWEDEYPVFLKTLRAVPADRLEYRPHPNSRSAADLVWLQVVEKRCWIELLETGQINWKYATEVLRARAGCSRLHRGMLAPTSHVTLVPKWATKYASAV